MLKTRIFSALVFVPVILVSIWRGGVALQILLGIIAMVSLWEYLRMSIQPLPKSIIMSGMGCVVLGLLAKFHWIPVDFTTVVMLLPIIGLIYLCLMYQVMSAPQRAAASTVAAQLVFGVLYSTALLPYLYDLRTMSNGLAYALGAVFCTWAHDTGAYFCGRLWGRHKLAAMISPNKTVEGFIGGVGWSLGVALLMRHGFTFPLAEAVTLALVASLFGTLGDLAESLLKRSAGVKDSSALIPGHGGFLDRFDALMFVAPAVYVSLGLLQT